MAAEAQRSGRCDLGSLSAVRSRLRDLFEARLLFEPDLAAMACRRASDEEIAHILSLGAAVEDAIRTGRDRTEYDQAFHQAIVSASHNDFLIRLVPIINRAVMEAIQLRSMETVLEEITLQDHALLMEFMKARDAAGAKQAMAIHLSGDQSSAPAGGDGAATLLRLLSPLRLPTLSACFYAGVSRSLFDPAKEIIYVKKTKSLSANGGYAVRNGR